MKRSLRGIMAAALSLMSGTNIDDAMKMSGMNKTHGRPRKAWTCKRCGDKFYPHRSNEICDECLDKRWNGVGE